MVNLTVIFSTKNNMVDGVVLLASYPTNDNLKNMGKEVLSKSSTVELNENDILIEKEKEESKEDNLNDKKGLKEILIDVN